MFKFLSELTSSTVSYFRDSRRSQNVQPNAGQPSCGIYREKYSPSGKQMVRQRSFSSETWDTIQNTVTQAKTIIKEWGPFYDLKCLLKNSPHVSEVINLRDDCGYTLIHHTIISNRPNMLQFLVTHGAELNSPVCARPLHLAAKLGYVEIVKILLEYDADPNVVSCVCYPEKHVASRTVYLPSGERWCTTCIGDVYNQDMGRDVLFEYPLYYAIMADSVECVKLLVDKSTHIGDSRRPLHLACKLGSYKCAQFFVNCTPTDVNILDKKGLIPIQNAVKWGRSFVEFLVLNGASVTVKTCNNETLFHLLFSQAKDVVGMAKTAQYLLDCGLKMNINTVDNGGNSALNVLLKRLQDVPPKTFSHGVWCQSNSFIKGRCYFCVAHQMADNTCAIHEQEDGSLLDEDAISMLSGNEPDLEIVNSVCSTTAGNVTHDSYPETQVPELNEEEREYYDTVKILLDASINPNIANKTGNTSLHWLSRAMGFHENHQGRPGHWSFRLIYSLFKLLLEKGANPKFVNNSENTVPYLLTCYGCNALLGPTDTDFQLPSETEVCYFLKCLKLLQQYGCDFDNSRHAHVGRMCLVHVVLGHLDKLDPLTRSHYRHEDQVKLGKQFVSYVIRILRTLLESGCTLNQCKYIPSDLNTLYYTLIGKLSLMPIEIIQNAIILMLQHGADPNVGGKHIPMSVFRYRNTSYWPVYPLLHLLNVIGSREVKEKESDLLSLFLIFYNTMEEGNARQCIFHYLEYDRYRNSKRSKFPELDVYLADMLNNPHKLKHISASYVYSILAKRTASGLDKLPLPTTLKRYICNFQY